MEKHLEKIRGEYESYEIEEPAVSKDMVIQKFSMILNDTRSFKTFFDYDHILSGNDAFLEYDDLRLRILAGFTYAMTTLLEAVNEDNFASLDKLGEFISTKACNNMHIVDCNKIIGADLFSSSSGDEDSLFTEVFFAEEFKRITGRNLVEENRGKVKEKK